MSRSWRRTYRPGSGATCGAKVFCIRKPHRRDHSRMRVDAHQHFWRLARNDYGWLTPTDTPAIYRDYLPADLAPLLKDCAVDKTVLVQCAETIAETEFLLDLAEEAPF